MCACPKCDGEGHIDGEMCLDCGGSGLTTLDRIRRMGGPEPDESHADG